MTDLPSSEFLDLIDAQFDEVTTTRVAGSIAADARHHQPWGTVHGGLYTAAIETFATVGAFTAVQENGKTVVGVFNSADFLRPHQEGRLAVVAQAVHQGRTQQLWTVELSRSGDGKPVARGQVRLQNIG